MKKSLTLLALLASAAPIAPAFAQSAASPFTSATRFDADRRPTGSIAPDPDGAGPLGFPAVRNSYDAAGRLTKVEKGTLSAWQSEAVAPANWTGFTIFQTVDTSYDALDRKTRETVSGVEPGGGAMTAVSVTQFSYDISGRLECTAQRMNPAAFAALPASACTPGTQGSQGPDRIVKSTYDAAGQLLQVREGVGTAVEAAEATRSYSLNGQLKQVIDANGNRAEMRYDGHDRLARWVFPSPSKPSAYDDATPASAAASAGALNEADYEAYQSDANGNRTSLRKRDGSTLTYQYDPLNRMIVKVVPERSGLLAAHTRDVYYRYDLRGLQTEARFDSLSGEGVSASYDGFGRLASSSISMGGVTRTLSAQYDAIGGRTELTYPDGVKISFAHDGLDRMTGVLEGALGAGVALATIAYDGRGQRASMTRRGGDATAYGYDGVARLKALGDTFVGATGNTSSTFGYNPASQITGLTRSNDAYAYAPASGVRSYAVNGLNQYITVGGLSQAHDLNGNLSFDGAVSYSYDIENRMVAASNGASLAYDPLGRLFSTSGAATGTTRFLYDGDELVAEYDGSGALSRRYVHGAGVDDPLVWYEGASLAAPRFLHTDHQGSITGIATVTGGLLTINRYDEYGMAAAGNQGRFGYTGQIWLPEVNAWHYKARMYRPEDGRFYQVDPIGYEDRHNLYDYVRGDPVNNLDPNGEACVAANGWSSYCRRAELYAIFDRKFGNQTRFFAAASATVSMLANMSVPLLGALASGTVRKHMGNISDRLERLNIQAAKQMESGSLRGANLDATMIRREQSEVQSYLNKLSASDPRAYGSLISGVNGLLNDKGLDAALASVYGTDRAYKGVLDRVRGQINGDINFANQSHRELIGSELVSAIRRGGGCDLTGSRIKSC
ncbi:MAG TPA: RHS repeat-associated core domain-containing protein [Allosphingosinicella sp.]|jgi:RHS repeat-associated protein